MSLGSVGLWLLLLPMSLSSLAASSSRPAIHKHLSLALKLADVTWSFQVNILVPSSDLLCCIFGETEDL